MAQQEIVKRLSARIREILESSDLATVSAKGIRKQLIAEGEDAAAIKNARSDLDQKISEIYDILTSNWPEISPPSPPSPQEPSSSSGNLPPSQQPLFKPNPPKRYRTTSPDDETDEQMARRLQEEYTGNGRPRRSTVGKNSKPVKKRKVISKARVDSDGEGSGSADETSKKSRRGGGGGGAFNKELILSEPLSDLVGTSRLSRPQVVKHIWDYVKERDLQDPKDRRYILCDEKLSRVFHTERLHMFTMNKVLVDHVRNPDEVL